MEEANKETNVKSTIEAVTGLVKAVPVYDDALQPAAKQVGKSLETVTRMVNVALAPMKGLVWGFEKIEEWLTKRLSEKLRNVAEEDIVTPSPQIAGPTIETLRYVAHDETLRELYANLLATAMSKETKDMAHPGFVEILKCLTRDEAILLKSFINTDAYPAINIHSQDKDMSKGYTISYTNFCCFQENNDLTRRDLVPSYLNNLIRLGILEQPSGVYLTDKLRYEPLKNSKLHEKIRNTIIEDGRVVYFDERIIRLTSLGTNFVNRIVKDPK